MISPKQLPLPGFELYLNVLEEPALLPLENPLPAADTPKEAVAEYIQLPLRGFFDPKPPYT